MYHRKQQLGLLKVGLDVEGTTERDFSLVGLTVLILAFTQEVVRPSIVGSEPDGLREAVDSTFEVGESHIALRHRLERFRIERKATQSLPIILHRLRVL